MTDRQLFLKYTLAGDSRLHVTDAFRIVIDGHGALMIHRLESRPERVDLSQVETFSIHAVAVPRRDASAVAA